jgi:hypothetical protein
MDPVTIAALAQAGYGLYDSLKNAGADRREAQNAEARAEAAKLRGQGVYKDLRDSARYRTAQAPVKAADLTLNLAQQGLDFARDQGQAAQSQLIAGLRDDPRNVGGLLRGLNQFQSNIEGAEQKAGQQAITAQKIIDDSIYAQREGERKRLSGLTEKYELLPSMQEYTSQTGLADTLRDRAASRTSDAIGGALDATVTLAGSLSEGAALRKAEEDARQKRIEAFNRQQTDANTQLEVNKPIPLADIVGDYDAEMAARRNALPSDPSMDEYTEITIDPEEEVDELDLEPIQSLPPAQIPTDDMNPELALQFMAGGKYIGERGGMTGGEFDHKTNKKAIIDEESGKKEGELTGGEGVLNKQHLAEIVEFIKEEDEDGLLSFLRNLLEEPQFGYDFA